MASTLREISKRAAPAVRRIIEMRRSSRELKPIPKIPKPEKIGSALDSVLNLLIPIVENAEHDAAMAALILVEHEFTEPLSRFEMKVLACALYKECSTNNQLFDYADILELTDKFSGRSMNITMVYRTIANLVERRLVDDRGRAPAEESSRQTQRFSINTSGRDAFRLSVLMAQHLRNTYGSAAA
jgi:hypothetical protein